MIRETRFTDNGDMITRLTYVVRAKDKLIDHIIERRPLDSDDIDYLFEPTVLTTPEVAYEAHLEGWRIEVENKCKEGFLRSVYGTEPLCDMELPENLITDMSVLVQFFDQFWTIEQAELVEMEMGVWKTRECCQSPPKAC